MGKARNEEGFFVCCVVRSVILCNVCGVFQCNFVLLYTKSYSNFLSFSYHDIFYSLYIGHVVALHAHILFSTRLMLIMQYRKSFGLKCVGVL